MNSPDVNKFFSCFAEFVSSPKRNTWGNTLKAFIFSLENHEGLPPFKCLAKNKRHAIFRSASYGPSFGEGPSFLIGRIFSAAVIGDPYSVPKDVKKKETVLAGKLSFIPDNYEVFHLS